MKTPSFPMKCLLIVLLFAAANIVAAYGKARGNLARHADGWPTEAELVGRIKSGNPQRGREHIGDGHDTEGSRWLIERIDADKLDHPLNLAIWGGQTDLAQALWRVKHDRGVDGFARFIQRFRVFDIDDQDHIADWIHDEFPGMFYILAKASPGRDKREGTYRGIYLGGDESLTSRYWIETNIRAKGPLGALYPMKTWTAPNPHGCMKEGDTTSWFFFLRPGGNAPADPSKPGWGGQYRKAPDGWYRDIPSEMAKGGRGESTDGRAAASADPRQAVHRWRPDFQQDFARRMGWCVAE